MIDPSKSVLVVEDERIVAKDLQQSLRALGYDAFAIASSAEEALTKVAERRPDVVLMDIRIRGSRDGIDVAHELRAKHGLPVIYLTAHADEGTLERARRTSPHGYLLKPVKGPELRIAIEIALYKELASRRLRERERWQETLLQSISDAVVSVGVDGTVEFVNNAAEALLAVRRADAVGFPVEAAIRLVDASGLALPATPDALRALAKSRRSSLLRAGDAVREVKLKVDAVVERGEALGFVVVLSDATEERKLQRQLELADRMSTVATMIAGLAAEVHNPLAILGANATFAEEELAAHADELPEGALDPRQTTRLVGITKLVGNARTAGLRIAKLVADLRTFARAPDTASGERTNVALAVARAVAANERTIEPRARVVVDVDVSLDAAIAAGRLTQLVGHLLSNAAHAIEAGNPAANEIVVTARKADGGVTIEVRDTGSGIPEGLRERIFEPFFTTKEVGGGMGLGLSVCAGIAASARGRLEVTSALGRGTTMRLTLPPS